MADLIVCLSVIGLQTVVGVSSLRFFVAKETNKVSLDDEELIRKPPRTVWWLTELTTIVYALVLLSSTIGYTRAITENVLYQSIFINVALLISLFISDLLNSERIKRGKKWFIFIKTMCYLYAILGFGFYYIYFIFRLGMSDLFI